MRKRRRSAKERSLPKRSMLRTGSMYRPQKPLEAQPL